MFHQVLLKLIGLLVVMKLLGILNMVLQVLHSVRAWGSLGATLQAEALRARHARRGVYIRPEMPRVDVATCSVQNRDQTRVRDPAARRVDIPS